MTTSAVVSEPLSRRRPRWLLPLVLVLLVIASVLAVTVLTGSPARNTGDLDPANPGFNGAQGLAHVLRDHGVAVTVVRGQSELIGATIDAATTVVITGTNSLSARTARTALEHTGSAARLVLLDPDPEVTTAMGLPVDSHLADLADLTARCQGTDVGEDFRLAQADRAYTATVGSSAATTCFVDKKGGGGAMVTLPTAAGRPPVVVIGDESLVLNGAILESDNAAIALRLLGHSNRLVWYVADVTDIAAADRTSRSIAPSWFKPGVALGASAFVLLCLWRGRRLGPLVSEPLPVIVRAVETTESRGRMYRRSRDQARALAVLQQATRRRLASYLGLSPSSSVSTLAAASGAVSGRSYNDVLSLLNSLAAHDDSALLERANALSELEKEVRGP